MALSLQEKYELMRGNKQYFKREQELYAKRIEHSLHENQRTVWSSPARRKLLICGRRWGKTVLNAATLVKMCLEKTENFYVNMTQTEAVAQLLPHIEFFRELVGFQGRMHYADSIYKFETGGIIHFRGYDSSASQRKVQGKKVTGVFILDEVQSCPTLKSYIDQFIRPMLADSPTSNLVLSGTPPRAPGHYVDHLWFDPNASKVWEKFNFGMQDNPLITDRFDEILLEVCTEKGLVDISGNPMPHVPFIRREYFGEMGAFDTDASVYSGRKTFDEAPTFEIDEIAIGVDWGFAASNAIVGLAFSKTDKRAWVFYEDKFNKAGAEDTILRCKAAFDEGKKLLSVFGKKDSNIACYVDHSHQHLAYDMQYRYNIPTHLATKTNKSVATEQLIDYLRSGRLLIKKDGLIDTEMKQVLWKRDDLDRVLNELDENLGIHPDLTDALLYASRRFTQAIGKIQTS